MPATTEISDPDLVLASRSGDRGAFSEIVRRYQAMISGLIYSSCGNLSASEDIAQETFLSAWKSLSGLRDPAKLPAWLCQIARHRITDHRRQSSSPQSRLARTLQGDQVDPSPTPADHAITQEQRELLWQNLAQIPEPYRETMVMFYRQQESAAAVAAALEITEESVRQRLVRGRQLLREQIVQMLERDLARTAPSANFTASAIASLPMMLGQAATSVTLAKATGATKSAGLLALGFWLAPIYAVGAAIYSSIHTIRASETPRERRFNIKATLFVWIGTLSSIGIFLAMHKYLGLTGGNSFLANTIFWFAMAIIGGFMGYITMSRHRALRVKEGLEEIPKTFRSPLRIMLSISAADIGGICWIVTFAGPANDKPWLLGAAGLLLVLLVVAYFQSRRPIDSVTGIYTRSIWHIIVIAIFSFIALNVRLIHWYAVMNNLDETQAQINFPRMPANLFLASIFTFVLVMTIVPALVNRKKRAV